MRKSGLKSFRDIQVDEQNILTWHGLIVPVSKAFQLSFQVSVEIVPFPPKFLL